MWDRKGGCLCGAVRYVLKSEPQAAAICHCTHCQKQSGSLFSFNLFGIAPSFMFERSRISVTFCEATVDS
jgi:hypothetical protein